MKGFVRLIAVVVAAAALIVSCGKDDDVCKITLDSPSLFIAGASDTGTVGFSTINVKSISVTSKPKGWDDPVIDLAAGTITVKAPDKFEGETVKTGQYVLVAAPREGGAISSVSLFVGVVARKDLSAQPANSYIIDKMETNYLLDATNKGQQSRAIEPASVKLVWQSASNLIQYLGLNNGKISFYVAENSDNKGHLKPGNAVVGGYDASGKLLWSWHLWISEYDAQQNALTYTNGYTVMDRNLGALENKNSTPEEILSSYGLYYQWGRKDPFVGPSTYKAGSGSSASMYNGSNSRVYLSQEESSTKTGSIEYATQHPLTFITGTKDSNYDWQFPSLAAVAPLWGNVKTVNDPCPYGWRVAPKEAFGGLRIDNDLSVGYEEYYEKYGWTLTDGVVKSLYMGVGRRLYTNGTIQNVYDPAPQRSSAMEAQPWEGLYWTTDANAGSASAFYFFFNKANVAASGVQLSVPHYCANGMQVRCVKM